MTEGNNKDSCKGSNEDHKFEDAKEFKEKLEERIIKDEEGDRIAKYLEHVVPNWRYMRPTRLYKHIQNMLDKADEIRRFEIDLIWKRAIYFIPLLVIFFTAFGSVFYITYEPDYIIWGMKIERSQDHKNFLFSILSLIAFANAFLSFCLARMNVASHRWQRNWEVHVDYLQAILGVNMIRTRLPSMTKFFTIRKTNFLISFFICAVWFLAGLFYLKELLPENYFNIMLGDLEWVSIILLTTSLLTLILYAIFVGECLCITNDENTKQSIHVTGLQALEYTKDKSVSNYKCCCKPCNCTCTKDQPKKQSIRKVRLRKRADNIYSLSI